MGISRGFRLTHELWSDFGAEFPCRTVRLSAPMGSARPEQLWEADVNEKRTQCMAASSGFMIAEAERRFPVRIRIGIPPDGLGSRFADQSGARRELRC
jgi:hypothetical protein